MCRPCRSSPEAFPASPLDLSRLSLSESPTPSSTCLSKCHDDVSPTTTGLYGVVFTSTHPPPRPPQMRTESQGSSRTSGSCASYLSSAGGSVIRCLISPPPAATVPLPGGAASHRKAAVCVLPFWDTGNAGRTERSGLCPPSLWKHREGHRRVRR